MSHYVDPETGYLVALPAYIDVATGEITQRPEPVPGEIRCEGQAVSRSEYPKLWEVLERAGLLRQEGEDNFVLPDIRSRFVDSDISENKGRVDMTELEQAEATLANFKRSMQDGHPWVPGVAFVNNPGLDRYILNALEEFRMLRALEQDKPAERVSLTESPTVPIVPGMREWRGLGLDAKDVD